MPATTISTGEMEVGGMGTKGMVAISGDGWRDRNKGDGGNQWSWLERCRIGF